MPTIDSLAVRLEADVAVFQQQLDRARAELSKFAAGTAPAATGAEKVGRSAGNSVPGLNRLNNAMITLTRQMTGVSPVVGQFTDVLGTMAIGTAKMIPLLAGAAGLAWAISKITEESRKAKREVQELAERLDKLRESQRGPGVVAFEQVLEAENQLRIANERLGKTLTPQTIKTDTGESVTVTASAQDIKKAFDNVELWRERLAAAYKELHKIGTDQADGVAKANEKAANEAAAAWKRAYAEIEAAARQFVEFHPLPSQIGITPRSPSDPITGGFLIPDLKPLKVEGDALARTFEKLNREASLVPRGAPPVAGGPGFFGTIGGNISSMLNPTMIASNIAGGFISSGISMAIGGLAKLGKSILGIGNHAEIAARQFRIAMANFQDAIIFATGSDAEQSFARARAQIGSLLEGAGQGADLSQFKTFEDLIEFIKGVLYGIRDLPDSEAFQAWTAALELSEGLFENLNEELSNLTDTLRNIPQGYKVALAQFNATAPAASMAGTTPNLTVTIKAEPEGIFRTVERRAVQVKRTGGQLAWEVA